MKICCEVCGSLIENCACPPCWWCQGRTVNCNEDHRFRVYLAAVEQVVRNAGGNKQDAALLIGINNTHIYRAFEDPPHISPTLKQALRENGYMRIGRKRFRLAAEWENEAARVAFIENNLHDINFTEWVEENDSGQDA